MTDEARKQAETFLKQSLASQKQLGYTTRVEKTVYAAAVRDVARAVDRLLAVQRRARAA